MIIAIQVIIALVAILHCLFFRTESINFMNPKVLQKFGLNKSEGEIAKVWAYNQGFYNLFLSFGLFYLSFA